MKFLKWIMGLLLFFTCMRPRAEAKLIHKDMCQMSTAYEDQMYKIADFEKGAFKGRFALMDGQCSGHTSYMAIVTYYHGGVKTTFLNDERIQKMKHVQVGEVLANQKGGVYLKIIFPNGTDWTGRGKLSLRQKIKSRSGIRIFLCMWKVYEPYTAAL